MRLNLNVVVLHGSPRKGMNSDTLAEHLLRGLLERGEHKITHFYTNEMEIKPCQGCLHCASSPGHGCATIDDMQLIYRAYREAELIVWATPMYWGYLTAQLKAVQDRMEALSWEGFEGKTFAVLVTYRYHCQSAVGMFERIAPHFKISLHTVTCCTYDHETRRDLPISACEEELEQAYQRQETWRDLIKTRARRSEVGEFEGYLRSSRLPNIVVGYRARNKGG